MSFPQPDPNQYVTRGFAFFRLNTLLSSPGDMYESPVSSHAIAIGPQADISRVNFAYFDDQIQTFTQLGQVSAQRSFVGQILARNDATYAPSNRPARIFFWPDDIFDPNFRPRGFSAINDSIQFIAPRMDVIQHFQPPPSLVPQRDDKPFVFQNYQAITGKDNIVVPYYGRKYCYVQFTNRNTTQANTFGILGVNYCITQNDTPNPYHQETIIRAPAAVGPGASVTVIISARNNGMFDALVFSVNESGPAPLRIVVSDLDQGA